MTVKDTIAKAAGAIKRAGATISGDTGIFRRLKEEHGEVTALMTQVKLGTEQTRRELFPRIQRELLAHARAEDQEFYPVLERHDEIRQQTEQISHEHDEIYQLMGRLETTPIGSDAWGRVFDTLVDSVKRHVDHEENELFPRAEKIMDEERAEEIERRYVQCREREVQLIEQQPPVITGEETTGQIT